MFPYLEKNLAFSIIFISEMELLSFSGLTKTEEQSMKSFISDSITRITIPRTNKSTTPTQEATKEAIKQIPSIEKYVLA